MAAGAPSGGVGIFCEFVAGTWTDISIYFDDTQDIQIQYGRTSEYSQPQTASISFLLDNKDGRFTPDRQLLADNTTTHPYYPNVDIRKRVQVRFTTATSTYILFTGYVKGWVPVVDPQTGAKTQVRASTREDKLNGVILKTPATHEYLADSPAAFWPLSDVSGSTIAVDVIANQNLSLVHDGSGGTMTFGQAGTCTSEDTCVNFAPNPLVGSQWLSSTSIPILPATASSGSLGYAIETWFNVSVLPGVNGYSFWVLNSQRGANGFEVEEIGMASDGSVSFTSNGDALNSSVNYADGVWHHVVAEYFQTASSGTMLYYIDGHLIGSTGTGPWQFTGGPSTQFTLANNEPTVNPKFAVNGQMALTAIYVNQTGVAPLSATRVAAHYAAGLGFVGDTTGQRVARFLGYAGLTSSDWNIDTCSAIVGPYATAGQSVIQAGQDMATTEGGGSAFYQTPDGKMRFTSRTFQKPGTPILTFDAAADLDGPSFTPTKDDAEIVTQSVATQNSGSSSGVTFTATNADAVSLYGLIGDSETSWAISPVDVLALAQSHIAAGWHPIRDTHARRTKGRLQTATLDVYTSMTAGLYDLVTSVQIGSRIRLAGLSSYFAASQMDVIVEGWTLTVNVDKFSIAWVTSSADNPYRFVWDDTTFGRWGPDPGSMTLHTALAISGGTVVVDIASGHPAFSTVSGDYPLSIQIGEEVYTCPTAPTGSATQQTFTGVLRGQQGTPPAPQAAGSPVNVWPAATWCL